MKKRGVSEVVTAILLVLIAIAAVIIVWQVVKPMISKSGEDIEAGFFTINLEIKKTEIIDDIVKVMVKRGVGEGSLGKIKIVLINETTSQVHTIEENLSELETKTFSFNSEISNPTKVEIYPVFIKDGKEKLGSLADSEKITFSKVEESSEIENLVAYYRFEGNALDETGVNNGIINGDPIYVDGKIGKALKFEGVGDMVNLSSAQTFSGGDEWTILAWVNITDWNINNDFNLLGYSQSEYYYIERSGVGDFRVRVGGGVCGIITDIASLGSWEFWSVVRNSTDIAFYINGVLKGQADKSNCNDIFYINLIGRGRGNGYSNGTIDEVRIYNRALSQNEISVLVSL